MGLFREQGYNYYQDIPTITAHDEQAYLAKWNLPAGARGWIIAGIQFGKAPSFVNGLSDAIHKAGGKSMGELLNEISTQTGLPLKPGDALEAVCLLANSAAPKYKEIVENQFQKALTPKEHPVSVGKYPKKWFEVLAVLKEKACLPRRILKWGPPGTGKSSWGVRNLNALRTPPLTPNMGKEELIGTFVLDRGNTVWVDGPVTLAMRKGRCVIIDEIDKAGPEIIAVLHGILDDPDIAEISLPQIDPETGEPMRVRPAAGFCVIATTNEHPSFIQPESLQDRFEVVIHCAIPHPDAMTKLSTAAKAIIGKHYANRPRPGDWKPEVSMRRMIAWQRISEALGDPDFAADLVFGPITGKEIMGCLANQALSAAS